MSEHIQPAPDQASRERERPETHEHTPGVVHESEAFAFWLIVKVGIGLAVVALIIQLLVWGLLVRFEKTNAIPAGRVSDLAVADAKRPLGERLDNVPAPHLEGIERESSLLTLRTEDGKEKRFYVAGEVRVRIKKEKTRLFELREGQPVTVVYHLPGGVDGGLGVVTSVVSPPEKPEEKKPHSERPDASRAINGTIVEIAPRSIAAAREWAEVQMGRYGWTDRRQGIVHVPVEKAVEDVLKSKEFAAGKHKKKSGGRLGLPTRSSSGRAAAGGQP